MYINLENINFDIFCREREREKDVESVETERGVLFFNFFVYMRFGIGQNRSILTCLKEGEREKEMNV